MVWHELAAALAKMKVLTEADLPALELLASAEARRRGLEADLQKKGLFHKVKTTAGERVERPRPQLAEAERVSKRVAEMLREFGLTPASRPKVQTVPGTADGEQGEKDDYFG